MTLLPRKPDKDAPTLRRVLSETRNDFSGGWKIVVMGIVLTTYIAAVATGFAVTALVLGGLLTLGWNYGLTELINAAGGTTDNISFLEGCAVALILSVLSILLRPRR